MLTKQKTQGVLYAVEKNNLFFLLLKRSPNEGGYWQPLTGSVETNETELICLQRELLEETGIDCKFVEFSEVIHEFTWSHDNVLYEEFVRGVKIPKEATIVLSEEHDEYKWCNLNEVLQSLKHESNKVGFIKVAESLGYINKNVINKF